MLAKDLSKLMEKIEAWGGEPQQVLEEFFLNDADFYFSCLVKFANEGFIQVLKESLVPEKTVLAIRTVHTMKGNADYLGLLPVLDATSSVLKDLRQDNLQQAKDDLVELETAYSQFQNLLAPFILEDLN